MLIDDKVSTKTPIKKTNQSKDQTHPWRVCPLSQHFVKECLVHNAPSKQNPEGCITGRKSYCADNPSKKDVLFFDEIQEITEKYFHQLSGSPNAGIFNDYPNADQFDPEIRGWVQYRNDVFSPSERLAPNLIKALIASESGFRPHIDIPASKKTGRARGLMQVTDETMRILGDYHGEIKDHYICFQHQKLLNPSANICTGIRWLFRKRAIANSKLGRQATWVEAVIEYKGRAGINPPHKEVEIFLGLYQRTLKG